MPGSFTRDEAFRHQQETFLWQIVWRHHFLHSPRVADIRPYPKGFHEALWKWLLHLESVFDSLFDIADIERGGFPLKEKPLSITLTVRSRIERSSRHSSPGHASNAHFRNPAGHGGSKYPGPSRPYRDHIKSEQKEGALLASN